MTPPLKTQISQLLDTYLRAFNTSNFKAASTYYHKNATAISASGVVLLPTPSDIAELLLTTVGKLKQDGFDHSEWVGEKTILVLEDDDEKGLGLVMASCGCKRVREDGSLCEEFAATYTLRKVDAEWLIVSIHQHPISTQLK